MASLTEACFATEFPSLLVHTSEAQVFQGLISVFGVDYFVRVDVEPKRQPKVKLFVDDQLKQVLVVCYSSVFSLLVFTYR